MSTMVFLCNSSFCLHWNVSNKYLAERAKSKSSNTLVLATPCFVFVLPRIVFVFHVFGFRRFADTRISEPAVFLCFSLKTPSLLYRLASVSNVSSVPFNLKRHASIHGTEEGWGGMGAVI